MTNFVKFCFVVVIINAVLFHGAAFINAQQINVSVQVMGKKSTETLNDFNYENLGQNEIATVTNNKVKGVSTITTSKSDLDAILASFMLVLIGSLIFSINKMKMIYQINKRI